MPLLWGAVVLSQIFSVATGFCAVAANTVRIAAAAASVVFSFIAVAV